MQQGPGTPPTAGQFFKPLVLVAALLSAAALPSAAESIAHADMPAPPPPPPPAAVPETPSRNDVAQALSERAADVRACTTGSTTGGQVVVRVRFESSGAVQSVTVNSTTLPDAMRSCIAEAVQKARVPPFRASAFNVNFPYRY